MNNKQAQTGIQIVYCSPTLPVAVTLKAGKTNTLYVRLIKRHPFSVLFISNMNGHEDFCVTVLLSHRLSDKHFIYWS